MTNQRTLTIVVTPTFWESAWGRLLIVLFILIAVASVTYTIWYIRRIRREQHETLEKYLALIKLTVPSTSTASASSELDPMLKRVMQFVEDHISNSDVNVGDMALAAATSRSGLQRKLKQAMGMTPQDLMREARIKRACQLLRQTEKTVSEVAYACGFTDPKYFSRIFKQSIGQAPTEYRTGFSGV
jgi:transcriptional regulator GlxA family with amidase domain